MQNDVKYMNISKFNLIKGVEVSKVCFFRKNLPEEKFIEMRDVDLYEIDYKSFFIVDEVRKEFLIYLDNGFVQELPYETKENAFCEAPKKVELIKVKTEDGYVSFYTNKENGSLCLDGAIKTQYSIDFDFLTMDFLRENYFVYKNYDVEWCGENYQVTDYFTKKLVSHADNRNDVIKDVDAFLEWKQKIPVNTSYYKERGCEIKAVSSPRNYPAFPFTFEITLPSEKNIKGSGISNVFETEKEAILRACYVAYDILNK